MILYQGKHLSLCGTSQGWEYVERKHTGQGVMIVAITDAKRLVLIEQERVPVGGSVIDLPAGLIDAGETAEMAAKRELWEETGYRCQSISYLCEGTSLPGLIGEINSMWLATALILPKNSGRKEEGDVILHAKQQGLASEGEAIRVYEVPVVEVPRWLADQAAQGKVINLKIYAALFFASSFLTSTVASINR